MVSKTDPKKAVLLRKLKISWLYKRRRGEYANPNNSLVILDVTLPDDGGIDVKYKSFDNRTYTDRLVDLNEIDIAMVSKMVCFLEENRNSVYGIERTRRSTSNVHQRRRAAPYNFASDVWIDDEPSGGEER